MNIECPHLASVSTFIDDELPDAKRAAVLEHVKLCAVCGQELEDLAALRAALGTVKADPAVKPRIFAALPLRSPAPSYLHARISLPLPAAAGILFVLGVSIFGNAYLGLNQQAGNRSQSGSGSFVVQQRNPSTLNSSPAVDPTNRETNRFSTGAQGNAPDARPSPSRDAGGRKPDARPLVFKQESRQGTILFVSGGDYRFSASPRIYAGEQSAPSKER